MIDPDNSDETPTTPERQHTPNEAISNINSDDDSDEQFDWSLPATHSYLSRALIAVTGREVLEAGWRGRLPCTYHHSVLYPGETVPMLLTDPSDCRHIHSVIQSDKLFGLLFVDNPNRFPTRSQLLSGFGVLCEIFEASDPERSPADEYIIALTFKARAVQRFRLQHMPRQHTGLLYAYQFSKMQMTDIEILPEIAMCDLLTNAKLPGLDRLRCSRRKEIRDTVKRMDAAQTPWTPQLVDRCTFYSLAQTIYKYFSQLKYESLPKDMVSLSFWAASNLPLAYADRLQLFKEDNAMLRLWEEAKFVEEYYVLLCQGCGDAVQTRIARCENIFAMSSEGMKSNYCNLGGYTHDIMTVTQVENVRLSGRPSTEFSWFPGYKWTILVCSHCGSHIGWRFTVEKKSYRRKEFYAICRNYVYPFSPTNSQDLPL